MNNKQLLNLLLEEEWNEARKVISKADNIDRLFDATYDGNSALFIAIWLKAPDKLILSMIEASDRAVYNKNDDSEQPLHYAVYYGVSQDVLEALILKNPAALDATNVSGFTPRNYLAENMLDERSQELMRNDTGTILEKLMKDNLERSHLVTAQRLVKMSERVRRLEEKATGAELEAILLKQKLESVARDNDRERNALADRILCLRRLLYTEKSKHGVRNDRISLTLSGFILMTAPLVVFILVRVVC